MHRSCERAAGYPAPHLDRGCAGTLRVAAVCAVLLSACSWHRVSPRLGPPPSERARQSVGLAAADADTSLTDLQAIARHWSSWKSFERVQFPFREGDPVDLVVEVKLRQSVDGHRASNLLKATITGLSLGLLGPVLGPRLTEIHDVRIRCRRAAGAESVPVDFRVGTDLEAGLLANVAAAAKDLDDEQMRRVAAEALRALPSACPSPDAVLIAPR
jgi:hypothetical protein